MSITLLLKQENMQKQSYQIDLARKKLKQCP